jgi:lysophospholipase L1-like esterase
MLRAALPLCRFRMPARTALAFRVLAFLLGVVVVAAIGAFGEWAARMWGDVESPAPLFDDPTLRLRNRPFVEPDDELGFRLTPGFSQPELNIDDDGFRVTSSPGSPIDRIVVALGDSTTFGWSVADHETYPAQLASMLSDAMPLHRVRVINAGVPSYTSEQVERYLRELLRRTRPDEIVVSVLWNDVWFSTVQNWYPELLVFAQPSPWRKFLNENSALFRWATQARRFSTPVRDAPNEPAREAYLANVSQAARLARQHGARAYLLVPPFDESRVGPQGLDPFQQNPLSRTALVERARAWTLEASARAAAEGAVVIDHDVSVFRPARNDLFVDPIHPNAAGYRLIAAAVASAFVADPLAVTEP